MQEPEDWGREGCERLSLATQSCPSPHSPVPAAQTLQVQYSPAEWRLLVCGSDSFKVQKAKLLVGPFHFSKPEVLC